MIYAVSGLKRTGKDTVSSFIKDLTGAKPYALAEPIKRSLFYALSPRSKLNLTWEDVNGQTDYDRETDLELSTLELRNILNTAVMFCNRTNKFNHDELSQIFIKIKDLSALDNMKFKDIICWSFANFFGNKRLANDIENKYRWSVRRLMQVLGTDLVVSVRRDYWLECIPETDGDIIITDIRQTHEMQYCRENNAHVIFVVKTGIVSTDSHITEKGLEPSASDTIVYNDGTLENLKSKIESIIKGK